MVFDTRWAPWKQQFSFNSTQSGDIDDWASSAITNPSTNYGFNKVISAGGFVFVFNTSYPTTCYRTTVSSGSLGSWTSVSTGISVNLVGFEIVWAGEYIYILGGLDYTSGHAVSSSAVYYAPINVDGSIGSWTAATSLPDGRSSGSAILVGNKVYYLGGQKIRYLVEFSSFVQDSKDTVYYADLSTYGVLGSWSTGSALPDLRGKSAVAVAGNTVYLLGGDKNSTTQSSIFTAPISGDVIGSWSTSGYSLASSIHSAITCVTQDTLYVIGGVDSSNYALYAVFYTGLNSSGEMTGALSYGTDLPGGDGLASFDVLITSTKVYLLGGYGNSGLESYAVEATFAGGSDDYTLVPEDVDLTPTAVTNSQTFYAASISIRLVPPLLTNTPTLFDITVAPGDVSLTPPLISNTSTVYSPRISIRLVIPKITNTSTFYAPTASPGAVSLSPPHLLNTTTVYAPTIAPQPVELSPPTITNAQTYYGPAITVGAVSLIGSLYTNTPSFFTHTASPGEVSLTSPLYTNTSALYAPTAAVGAVSLSPSVLNAAPSFYDASITTGDVSLQATMRVTNSSDFYSPLITLGDLSLTLPYTANQSEFYLTELAVGDVDLSPPFLENSQEIYSLEVYIGDLALSPQLLSFDQEFFSLVVVEGGLAVFSPFVDSVTSFYSLSLELVGTPLPDFLTGSISDDSWASTLDQPWEGVVLNDNRISVGIS